MRSAKVYRNNVLAGVIKEFKDGSYKFEYDLKYLSDKSYPAISLTMPKTTREYQLAYLFPFFFNMLSEGANRELQVRHHQIDDNDHFGLLLATSKNDTIGAVTLLEMKNDKD